MGLRVTAIGVLVVAACSTPYAPSSYDGGAPAASTAPTEGPPVPTTVPSAIQPADAGLPISTCALGKDNDPCTTGSTCCGGHCRQNLQCATDCKVGGLESCNPLLTNECCIGLYCGAGSCVPCIPAGGQAAKFITGGVNPNSCCSGIVDTTGPCR